MCSILKWLEPILIKIKFDVILNRPNPRLQAQSVWKGSGLLIVRFTIRMASNYRVIIDLRRHGQKQNKLKIKWEKISSTKDGIGMEYHLDHT